MSILNNKIDFAIIFSVNNANPNGDPLNGNRPRETYSGLGEVSDVCLKRKIRNRMLDMGCKVFVQSDDKRVDDFKSLQERAESIPELKKEKDPSVYSARACQEWLDVRSFGQLFAFKGNDLSVGIRGPVSIQSAISIAPVDITSLQITKSVNSTKEASKKASDTMGMKHRVDRGIYVAYGAINCQLAEKTGFSEEDAETIKQALISLFENDSSSARPDGSMEVCKVYWWKHNSKSGQYSSAKVHRTLKVLPAEEYPFYTAELNDLPDLNPEVYEGK